MSQKPENQNWRDRLTTWVDGDREDQDRTLFVMEQRPPRHVPRTEAEHEARERRRLVQFFNWYPLAAVVLCGILTLLLLSAVLNMPGEGVVQAGEGIAAGSWELELLGESCLLFLAMSGIRVLLRGREADQRVLKSWLEITRADLMQGLLVGMVLLTVLVELLGGIAGGAVTGAVLAVPTLLRGGKLLRCRGYAQAGSLLLCVVLCGISIYAGTNGYPTLERVTGEFLEFSAGLSAVYAVYGLCSLAAENQAKL